MSRQLELMALRERRFGELVERISQKSRKFRSPRIIVIGGYALRAYVPFTRYSRDCDFALSKGRAWSIDRIAKWLPGLSVEAKQHLGTYGFLRLIQLISAGKLRLKISLDFMEGEVRGRSEEGLRIDRTFVADSLQVMIQIGERPISISVPSYQDYFLLKLFSGRPSDIRDIAALVWKRGTPDDASFFARASETLSRPAALAENLGTVIADVADPRFLDSWRGTFITEEFTEADKRRVAGELKRLQAALTR